MIKTFTCSVLIALSFLAACNHNDLPLPTPYSQDNTTFGANDTNYVELSPMWNAANLGFSFSKPTDITIGLDGIIYVADTGNDRVVAMSKSGRILSGQGFEKLSGIPHPSGVSVDSKLNVLISNQTNTVYGWNQFFNLTEIDSAADRAAFFDPETNETVAMTFTEYLERLASGGSELQLVEIQFTRDVDLIQSAKDVYPLFTAEQPGAQINSVAAGPYGSGLVYITESEFDKVSEILLVPKIALKTSNGNVLFQYQGVFMRDIAQFGSGAGTVDDPWAIKVDAEGHIYFSQLGGNFRVQKLRYPTFDPAYVLGVHDIMDLQRFIAPTDIALDDQNALFVIDRDNGQVSKYHIAGRRAGQQAYLGKRGLATATFEGANGIMVDNNIVYVVESDQNRIRRFQYSINEDDVPDDDKKP